MNAIAVSQLRIPLLSLRAPALSSNMGYGGPDYVPFP